MATMTKIEYRSEQGHRLTFRRDGLLVHTSGYPATFGFCGGCGQERYLGPGCCAAQDAQVNSICKDCERNKIGTGFNSVMA